MILQLKRAALIIAFGATAQAVAAAEITEELVTAAETVEQASPSSAELGATVTQPVDPGEAKFWAAMKYFRSKLPADLAAGRADLEASAGQEFTHAQLFLGECYQSASYGYTIDQKKGTSYYRLAAERGNAFAKVSYGLCLFSGVGTRKDVEKATQWLNAALAPDADYAQPRPPADFFVGAADHGNEGVAGANSVDHVASAQARAHYILGVILEGNKNPSAAHEHYLAAATAGMAGRAGIQQAAQQAALNFAFGRGISRDPQKANEMLAKARTLARREGISTVHSYATAKLVDDFAVSELEEAVAKASDEMAGETQLNIARQFTDKKSKDYNPREAVQWFELAAESGRAWAMLELALLYSRGDLGEPDREKAFTWFERVGSGEKPKHILGVANLVICYENGLGTPKNPEKARALAARFKNDELVCYLCLQGKCPAEVLSFEQSVALNQRWAGELKDPQAQYLLGLRYEGGFGVSADLKDAVSWYKKAVKAKHGPACRQLGLLYQYRGYEVGLSQASAYKKAVECFRAGIEARDAVAATCLAIMTSQGDGTPASADEAKRLYERSLELDPTLAIALNNLSIIYEARFRAALKADQQIIARLNRTMMMDLLQKADRAGYDLAAFNLGRLCYDEAVDKVDWQKAYSHFEVAAERGNVEARFRLGQMHEKGEGLSVSYTEAAYHYRLAGLDNHVGALWRLVAFYMEGRGGVQDLDRAKLWLGRLAKLGDRLADTRLADFDLQEKRYKDAQKEFEILSKDPRWDVRGIACERLSRCYRDGLGVKVNPKRANELLNAALDLRNPEAMCRVASSMIKRGNVDKGLGWFVAAAKISPAANFALGQLYFFGQVVPANRDLAMKCFRRAANARSADALYFLAAMTYKNEADAPPLTEAIEFARAAEAMAFPKSERLREKLEERYRAVETKEPVNADQAT